MSIQLPLTITGTVLHGNKLGNTIGMPTANISLPSNIEGIAFGVYYSKVSVWGKTYRGISNVGEKPTVQDSHKVNVETYLYDFDGNLYDEDISVTLLEFRRPEMKFNSFEELSVQMHLDLEAGRIYESM